MRILTDVVITTLLFVIFAFLHSYMASFNFKKHIKLKFGKLIAFYRIIYNVLSLILFSLVLIFTPKNPTIVYDLETPYDLIIYFLQILSLFGLLWTVRYFDWKEFLGINQIKRFLKGNYNEEYDERYSLIFEGPYKVSRHPVYLFSILFLAFKPYMTVFYLNLFSLIIIYFYVGSYHEEKRLEQLFGQKYIEYKNQVSRIFPIKWLVKKLI